MTKHPPSQASQCTLSARVGKAVLGALRSLMEPADAKKRRAEAVSAGQRAAGEERKRVFLIKRDLYQLLQRHPDSRKLMRNLYRVESLLRHGGLAALQEAPSRVLVRGLDELERLVWDWSPTGLADLRSRMAVLVKSRPVGEGIDNAVSSQAIDHSDFERARVDVSLDVSEIEADAFEAEWSASWIDERSTPAPLS